MRRRTRAGTVVAVVVMLMVALVGGACGGGEDRPGSGSVSGTGSVSGSGTGGETEGGDKPAFSAAEADAEVEVTMTDYAFAGIPASVKGPEVLFEVTNQGPAEHEFEVFRAGEDKAVDEIEPFAKGKSKSLALELKPGSYTVTCQIELGDKTHAELGMKTDFTVE